MLNKQSGFTNIEFIVAILIAGIIMSAAGSFLNFNIRGFYATKDVIDIQYEGQLGINQLTSLARESIGISAVEDDLGNSLIDLNAEVTPDSFSVIHYDTSDNKITYTITYDQTTDVDNKKLNCFKDYEDAGETDVTYMIAQYVSGFSIEPINNNDFEYSDGIIIRLEMSANDATYDLQTEVKFRNKH